MTANEGYNRFMNRRQWADENRDRKLTETEERFACVALCTMMGAIGALALVAGIQADCGPSL